MPHVPLKVLRGEEDRVDTGDENYERFQAPPGTSTEEREAEDGSSLSGEGFTDPGEEGGARYLGSSVESVNQSQIDFDQMQHGPNNVNNPEYDTTGSVNTEATDVQVVAQVHVPPNRDDTESESLSNDDMAPLLPN